MATSNESRPDPAPAGSTPAAENAPPPVEQVLARVIRHEVADLLQTVYSAVAVLHDRFSAGGLEHQLLGFLKGRAETCRLELDAVVDIICPITLRTSLTDLSYLTGTLLVGLKAQFPDRLIELASPGPLSVEADASQLTRSFQLLLRTTCQLAARLVRISLAPAPAGVVWSVVRDGPGLTDEQRSWLERPFTTTRSAPFGLGLALARRVAVAHGGGLTAENLAEGGVALHLTFPVTTPPSVS